MNDSVKSVLYSLIACLCKLNDYSDIAFFHFFDKNELSPYLYSRFMVVHILRCVSLIRLSLIYIYISPSSAFRP